MTLITNPRSLPDSAKITAARLALAGFPQGTWAYDSHHGLADPDRVVQVRNIKGIAKNAKVDRYATAMEPYTLRRDQLLMPPVVFSGDGRLIDGNTRTAAARKLGWTEYPAFILGYPYDNAPASLVKQFTKLAALSNLEHGDNLDRGEIEGIVDRLLDDDTSARDLALQLGIARSTVQGIAWARIARTRAERLHREGNLVDISAPHITRTHLADLGRADKKILDPVWVKLMELTVKAKLSSNEQRDVLRRLDAATTEPAKLALIAGELGGSEGIASGRASKPNQASQLRQALGKVNGKNPGDLLETNPERFELHRSMMQTAIRALQEAYDRQVRMENQLAR